MKTSPPSQRGTAILLCGAAGVTLVMKYAAFRMSHSVGIFSDTAESLVNVTTAVVAFFALTYATMPADDRHAYGHEKIEFFAAGLEGALIMVAALWIGWEATDRLLHPQRLTSLGTSALLAGAAAAINGGVAMVVKKSAQQHDSMTLEASAQHLFADVWTTIAVLVGLGIVIKTGHPSIDVIIALVIGVHVLLSGFRLLRRSISGLMDVALPAAEVEAISSIIHHELQPDWQFHALRTRKSGPRRFVDFHLLLPGRLSLEKSHRITTELEKKFEAALAPTDVTIHVEPIEDPSSWEESSLSRLSTKHHREVT